MTYENFILLLEFIFCPWAQVIKLKKMVQEQLRVIATLQEQRPIAAPGQPMFNNAASTLPPKLFGRIEELRQQLLNTENAASELSNELQWTKEDLQLATQRLAQLKEENHTLRTALEKGQKS